MLLGEVNYFVMYGQYNCSCHLCLQLYLCIHEPGDDVCVIRPLFLCHPLRIITISRRLISISMATEATFKYSSQIRNGNTTDLRRCD